MAERKDDNGFDEFGNPLPTATSKYSETKKPGMDPVYETISPKDRSSEDGPPKLLGYAYSGTVDVPKPASVLELEKKLGTSLGAYYDRTPATHDSGQGEEYGPPKGYAYDNGQGQNVLYDADGNYIGLQQKRTVSQDLLPLIAAFAGLSIPIPGISNLLGGGAGAAAPLTFTPEMIAAGMTPGGIGAAGAAANVLTDAQLAAMYGVNSGIATLAPTLSQLPSGPPSTPGTPPPPNLDLPPPSGIETLPSGPPSTPGTPPPPPSGIETLPSGPPSTPGTPPPPNLDLPTPIESPLPTEPPIPGGPPSTPGTPPPPDVGPPGSNLEPPIPSGPPSTPGTPPPPDVGPPGSNIPPVIPPVTPGIKDLLGKIKDILPGSGSGSGMGILGLMALMSMMNKGGGGTPASTATIPELTATRSQLPYDVNKTGVNPNTPYRPGQGGVNYFSPTTYTPKAAGGGLMSLGQSNLGGYSDGGRLLQGPGDGVSDSIPAIIGRKQPARLANGEFVIPARIVSELGNGSTDAGAKRLYEMMDRVQKVRRNTKNVAANTKASKYLPA
jgi:hypothetical protein